jgi:hypothetical protein
MIRVHRAAVQVEEVRAEVDEVHEAMVEIAWVEIHDIVIDVIIEEVMILRKNITHEADILRIVENIKEIVQAVIEAVVMAVVEIEI